uniref:Uncharacterized protein n=1 Tax=Oryza sativa subsp. japonica TaxID=39947 RepID=Q5VMR8_ORYSJ|nr:hypothetical protein [Oryza sativa Japonica Group]
MEGVYPQSPAGKTVKELHIGIGKPHGPVLGLQRARHGYVLGKSAAFAYVVRAAPPADMHLASQLATLLIITGILLG